MDKAVDKRPFFEMKGEKTVETTYFTKKTLMEAAHLLKEGQVVAFPTETVYGLGADATSDEAVRRIYEAKGRPGDNPLISHVASIEQVEKYAFVPEQAYKLMKKFWPGPLTLVLCKKEDGISKVVTAGLPSASFRMPDNQLTLELIRLTERPLAGPSANTSGRPSPTDPEHVFHDLQGRIAGILDDGPTRVGVESTVLDLTDAFDPVILRPGAISPEEIEAVIGPVNQHVPELTSKDAPKSPGMKYQHYSPAEPVFIVSSAGPGWEEAIHSFKEKGEKVGLLADETILNKFKNQAAGFFSLGTKGEAEEAARNLYAGLRYFENTDVTVILAQELASEKIGLAYMNRLEKAAGFKRI